jgi:hypothetical protein
MSPAFVPEARPAARPSPSGALRAALTVGLSSLGSWRVVMNGPNNERSYHMAKKNQIITLYGNLGGDPAGRRR